jgi:hypothetical protein
VESTVTDHVGNHLHTDRLEDLAPQERPQPRETTIGWPTQEQPRWTCRWTDNGTGTAGQCDHRNIVRRISFG